MSGDAPRDSAPDFWKDNPRESTEEAEIGLLGAALADDTGEAARVLFGVAIEDFSAAHCAAVASAISAAMNGKPAPDPIAVAVVLRERGETAALQLVTDKLFSWPTGANAPLYAQRIRYFATARRESHLRRRLAAAKGRAEQDKARADLEAFEALAAEGGNGQGSTAPVAASSWDMADLRKEPPEPEARQFVHRLFVRPSFNIVFAPAQSGKSWAIMGLCADAVTGGGKFMGCEDLDIFPLRDDFTSETPRVERVLWVFGNEDTKSRVRRRAESLLASQELDPGRFIIATPPSGLSIHLEEGWRWLLAQVDRHEPSILVLDTLASLAGHTLDLTDNMEVTRFMNRANALRDAKQVVIFALHHSRKGALDAKKGARDQADSMMGASALRGLADGVLRLDAKDGDTSDVQVSSIKAKDIANPIPSFRACLESPSGRFRVLDRDEAAPEREAVATTRTGRPSKFSADAVLELRPRFPTGIGWNEVILREALGISRALWFDRNSEVGSELIARGCTLAAGSLSWPKDGPSAPPPPAQKPAVQSSLPGFLDSSLSQPPSPESPS